MEMKSIEYSKVFNLGNYSNEKIGVVIDLAPGENPLDAFAQAKKTVEKSHSFFTDLPSYEQAKKMMGDQDSYTGRDIKRAAEAIAAFEANYPDYIAQFIPANRTLTEGERDEYRYQEEE